MPAAWRSAKLATGFLARANDDRVDIENLGLAIDLDVQPVVVDTMGFDAAGHRDATLFQQGAANPAGRFGETGADFFSLSLQQPELARRRWIVGRHEPAAVAIARIDAPFHRERGDGRIVRTAVARVSVRRIGRAEQFRDIETDSAGADERDALARLPAPIDDPGIARHLGVVDAGDRRRAA